MTGEGAAWQVTGVLGTGAWSRVYAAERVRPCPFGHPAGACPAQVALKVVPLVRLPPVLREAYESPSGPPVAVTGLIRVYHRFIGTDRWGPVPRTAAMLVLERAVGSLAAARWGPRAAAGPLLAAVCDAMATLLRAGWVHGNLTAGNVLLMPDGTPRIGDLDQIRPLRDGSACVPAFGSIDYLPPEWWTHPLGDHGVHIGPEHDVWAYGVLAHRVLTGGRHPFPGDRPARRAAAVRRYGRGRARLRLAADLPAPWPGIVADCLRREPGERGTFGDLRQRLPVAPSGPVTLTPHRDTTGLIKAMMVDTWPRVRGVRGGATKGAGDG